MSIQLLIQHFDQYLSLDEAEIEALSERIRHKKLKRRQFLLQEGDICRHYNFVLKGCLKQYYIDPKGNEHNLQFAAENEWITNIGSFHSEQPSRLFIEAIEPVEVLQIEKQDLILIYTHYPKFDRNFRVMMEDQFVELQNRLLQNISSTAQERYLSFLDQYPHLSNRLPGTQIASYLGITPEFLSTVKRQLAAKS